MFSRDVIPGCFLGSLVTQVYLTLTFTVYLAAASGHSSALPCFAAIIVLSILLWVFPFTQFIIQTSLVQVFGRITKATKFSLSRFA